MKGRVATEWLLTEFPDDTQTSLTETSKDFMRWPENSSNSPTSDTNSPMSEPPMALRRDRVA
jgi:hypothetical protein